MTSNEKRFAVLQAVLFQYGDPDSACQLPETADDADFGDIPQFVMVERDGYHDSWYDFGENAEELCEGAACDDSEYEPMLVVDLDTGEARNVQVAYSVAPEIAETFAPAVQA